MNDKLLLYQGDNPRFLCVQLMAEEESAFVQEEIAYLKAHYTKDFSFIAYPVTNWNDALSPWPAKAVFGKNDFGGNAQNTLKEVEALGKEYDLPVILGGYSLASLFSLWAGYKSDAFTALACASPSVWYEGWDEFINTHPMQAKYVYLSLGDKEDKSKNPTMQKVRERILLQEDLLVKQGVTTTLEWNEGNHFKDVNSRLTKAFGWCLKQLMEGEN
ncbi:MAG: hypothetical protein J6D29_00780 [Solobacterium sp.]|nr:hypothetical protein [Solobacterium sp.]